MRVVIIGGGGAELMMWILVYMVAVRTYVAIHRECALADHTLYSG